MTDDSRLRLMASAGQGEQTTDNTRRRQSYGGRETSAGQVGAARSKEHRAQSMELRAAGLRGFSFV